MGQITNLVQKDVPTMGRIKSALPVSVGARICPLEMSKKLALHECFRQCSAIDLDKGLAFSRTNMVNGLGDQFLARTAVPENGYRGTRMCGIRDQINNLTWQKQQPGQKNQVR